MPSNNTIWLMVAIAVAWWLFFRKKDGPRLTVIDGGLSFQARQDAVNPMNGGC